MGAVRTYRASRVDVGELFQLVAQSDESPNIIMVDDSKVILTEGLAILSEVMPDAQITGFIWSQEAIEYAKANRVMLAFLDIELGTASGFMLKPLTAQDVKEQIKRLRYPFSGGGN